MTLILVLIFYKQLIQAINTLKPTYYVICTDSNAHSSVWFGRGETILDFISQNNLIIANTNENEPTFRSTNGESSIDLTLHNLSMNYALDYISCTGSYRTSTHIQIINI